VGIIGRVLNKKWVGFWGKSGWRILPLAEIYEYFGHLEIGGYQL